MTISLGFMVFLILFLASTLILMLTVDPTFIFLSKNPKRYRIKKNMYINLNKEKAFSYTVQCKNILGIWFSSSEEDYTIEDAKNRLECYIGPHKVEFLYPEREIIVKD